jgi:hypothetical protein
MMRPSTSSFRSRAVARRLLARRAVARRTERRGTAGTVTSVESGDCGAAARSTVRCVVMAEDLPTLWRCRATGEGTRPNAWIRGRPRGSRSWPRAPRLSAIRASVAFGLRGLKSWPAGSARLPTVLPFGAGYSRVTQCHASPTRASESDVAASTRPLPPRLHTCTCGSPDAAALHRVTGQVLRGVGWQACGVDRVEGGAPAWTSLSASCSTPTARWCCATTRWSRCWPVEHSVTPHNVYDAGSSCTARRSTPSIRSPTPRSAGDIDVLGRRLVPQEPLIATSDDRASLQDVGFPTTLTDTECPCPPFKRRSTPPSSSA